MRSDAQPIELPRCPQTDLLNQTLSFLSSSAFVALRKNPVATFFLPGPCISPTCLSPATLALLPLHTFLLHNQVIPISRPLYLLSMPKMLTFPGRHSPCSLPRQMLIAILSSCLFFCVPVVKTDIKVCLLSVSVTGMEAPLLPSWYSEQCLAHRWWSINMHEVNESASFLPNAWRAGEQSPPTNLCRFD